MWSESLGHRLELAPFDVLHGVALFAVCSTHAKRTTAVVGHRRCAGRCNLHSFTLGGGNSNSDGTAFIARAATQHVHTVRALVRRMAHSGWHLAEYPSSQLGHNYIGHNYIPG